MIISPSLVFRLILPLKSLSLVNLKEDLNCSQNLYDSTLSLFPNMFLSILRLRDTTDRSIMKKNMNLKQNTPSLNMRHRSNQIRNLRPILLKKQQYTSRPPSLLFLFVQERTIKMITDLIKMKPTLGDQHAKLLLLNS